MARKPKRPRQLGKKRAVRKKTLRIRAAPAGPADIVDIPPKNTFNKNLSSATEATMLQFFDVPGEKTDECSPATGAFKKRVLSRVDVGPFKVSGLDIAVKSLKAVFDEAEEQIPNVVAAV